MLSSTGRPDAGRWARAFPAALATLLALACMLALRTPAVLAATPDLTLVTDARYQVIPDERRVAITIQIKATNRLKATVTRQYYFDRAYLAVLPGTSGFRVSASSGTPKVSIQSKQTGYWLLRIDFPSRLAAGKSVSLKLTMDLKDPGGSPTRTIRIGPTLVSFPIWAYGSTQTPGSSVAVVFPPDFQVQFEAGSMDGPATADDGSRTWTSDGIKDALTYYAYVVADNPGAYEETARTVDVAGRPAELLIRAWPDDPEWGQRISDLFERGLPVLAREIGVPWPLRDPLIVQEAVSRSSSGYAGLYDSEAGHVEVAYYADPLVVLHEAAHAWFNGDLLADRWSNEAFASWYALAAAEALGEPATPTELTSELQANAIPLNAWGAVGDTPREQEDYAYAASLELARRISERAGSDGLAAVWAAAADHIAPYQPVAGPLERTDGRPDWRGLLDLLEEPDEASFADLWLQWVTRPEDAALLDARAGARIEYDDTEARAGDWILPRSIREAMRAWQFDAATSQLGAVRRLLEQRDAISQETAELGLDPPETLRTLFERNGALEAALAEAIAERTTIATIREADASRPPEPNPFQLVGLIGESPAADLSEARAAFAEGDLTAAEATASRARLAWLAAEDYGRTRLLSALLLLVAVVVALASLVARLRRLLRRADGAANGPANGGSGARGRHGVGARAAGGPSGTGGPGPTLIRDPGPPRGGPPRGGPPRGRLTWSRLRRARPDPGPMASEASDAGRLEDGSG
jgi:hypothetical protein